MDWDVDAGSAGYFCYDCEKNFSPGCEPLVARNLSGVITSRRCAGCHSELIELREESTLSMSPSTPATLASTQDAQSEGHQGDDDDMQHRDAHDTNFLHSSGNDSTRDSSSSSSAGTASSSALESEIESTESDNSRGIGLVLATTAAASAPVAQHSAAASPQIVRVERMTWDMDGRIIRTSNTPRDEAPLIDLSRYFGGSRRIIHTFQRGPDGRLYRVAGPRQDATDMGGLGLGIGEGRDLERIMERLFEEAASRGGRSEPVASVVMDSLERLTFTTKNRMGVDRAMDRHQQNVDGHEKADVDSKNDNDAAQPMRINYPVTATHDEKYTDTLAAQQSVSENFQHDCDNGNVSNIDHAVTLSSKRYRRSPSDDITPNADDQNQPNPPACVADVGAAQETAPPDEMSRQRFVTTCSICQDDFVEQDLLIRLPCGHILHEDCIKQWFGIHNTCPECRQSLPTEESLLEDDDS